MRSDSTDLLEEYRDYLQRKMLCEFSEEHIQEYLRVYSHINDEINLSGQVKLHLRERTRVLKTGEQSIALESGKKYFAAQGGNPRFTDSLDNEMFALFGSTGMMDLFKEIVEVRAHKAYFDTS